MTTLYLHPFDKFNILDDMSLKQCSTIECKEVFVITVLVLIFLYFRDIPVYSM